MVFFQRRLTRLLLIAFVFLFVLYALSPVEKPRYLPQTGQIQEALNKHVWSNLRPINKDTATHQTEDDADDSDDADDADAGSGSSFAPEKPSHITQEESGPLQIEKELKNVDDFQEYVENLIISSSHPPYMINGRRMAFDPNRWRDFDPDSGFERNRVHPEKDESAPYLPYPDYNSEQWSTEWEGVYVPCKGARGIPLPDSTRDQMHAYRTLPTGFPKPSVGASSAVGLSDEVCFDLSRYDPYGLTIEEQYLRPEEAQDEPDWTNTMWGALQDECVMANKDRYSPHARRQSDLFPGPQALNDEEPPLPPRLAPSGKKYQHRTAIVIRAWEGYSYTHNDIRAIRALITELSLFTGGEYSVFLLVDVKTVGRQLYTNKADYERIMMSIPQELRSITILWTQDVCEEAWPRVGNWDVYWHQWMPLQWFAKTHPEFDYFWNWEMDVRYTGHHYEIFEKLAEFAKAQPRKYLWERNKRFYFPAAHGSYEDFIRDTNEKVAEAETNGQLQPVWGPAPYSADQNPIGPTPPQDPEEHETWGVGEEADLITLLPAWDPRYTQWTMRHKIWNFIPGVAPQFSPEHPKDHWFGHPEMSHIDRRVFINTVSRLSRRQLHAMHLENKAGRTMTSEMWPATASLHHGLKVVYAPHPIWFNRKWPAVYADVIFNAHSENDTYGAHDYPDIAMNHDESHGSSKAKAKHGKEPSHHKRSSPEKRKNEHHDVRFPAQWSERMDSVYNIDRELNFKGWSFYFHSEFPDTLYRRWMGWLAQRGGGAEPGRGQWTGSELSISPNSKAGRICLPGMILHPVKSVRRQEEPKVEY